MIAINKKIFDSIEIKKKSDRKGWGEIFSKLEIGEGLRIEKEEYGSHHPSTMAHKWKERYGFKMSFKVVDGYIYCLRVE